MSNLIKVDFQRKEDNCFLLETLSVKSFMLIYKITNEINGKCYIGQTVNSFDRRYDGGKWWLYTSNIHLKRAVKKYGLENFSLSIVEENILSESTLDQKEIYYIKKYNSLYPYGYNFLEGGSGRKHHAETADKISLSLRKGKKYLFKSPSGEIMEIINLAKFCRENNLNETMMQNVSKGQNKKHRGWTLPNFNIRERKIISPEGEVFSIKDGEISKFCRKHNISKTGLLSVWSGKLNSFLGWRNYSPELENKKFLQRERYKANYSFINVHTGKIEKGVNLSEFANNNSLHLGELSKVNNGKAKSHKGWKKYDENN